MIKPANSIGNGIVDQHHYNNLRARHNRCAEIFYARIVRTAFNLPNPTYNYLKDCVLKEIDTHYPKLNSKNFREVNYLTVKDYCGVALDFLYESFNKEINALGALYEKGNPASYITQAIYLSYKVTEKDNFKYLAQFSYRYQLDLEHVLSFDYENEGPVPNSFEQKVLNLLPGRYLVLLSNEITLAFIKLRNSTGYIFDPSYATVYSLNPAKAIWNISSKYGYPFNHIEFIDVTETIT